MLEFRLLFGFANVTCEKNNFSCIKHSVTRAQHKCEFGYTSKFNSLTEMHITWQYKRLVSLPRKIFATKFPPTLSM
jgi:hypothetical protein